VVPVNAAVVNVLPLNAVVEPVASVEELVPLSPVVVARAEELVCGVADAETVPVTGDVDVGVDV
jgi:hypothetical protein